MSSTHTSQSITAVATPTRHVKDVVFLGGLFGLVLVGLIALAAATGWDETLSQIGKLTVIQFAGLLALSLVNYIFRGFRWHIFARGIGLQTGFTQNFRHFLGGFAMSVTPGRIGELVRMRWLKRETGWSFERTAPLALVDRAFDLAAMAVILGVSVALSATGINGGVPVALAALAAAVVVTRPRLLGYVVTRAYKVTGLFPRLFARVRHAARSLHQFSTPQIVTSAMALGLIGWVAEGFSFYLLLTWMGADVGMAMAIAIFVFATLAGGLTGAPGGVGGAEAAMVALLSLEGIPLEVSLPATLIIRVTTLWFAIGVGLIVFPIAERFSMKETHALENI